MNSQQKETDVQPASIVSDLRSNFERLMLPGVAITDPGALNSIFTAVQGIVDHLTAENQKVMEAKAAEEAFIVAQVGARARAQSAKELAAAKGVAAAAREEAENLRQELREGEGQDVVAGVKAEIVQAAFN